MPMMGFSGDNTSRDGPRDVVFEQPVAVGRQERNGRPLVGQGDAQAEVKIVFVGQLLRLQPVQPRRILRV